MAETEQERAQPKLVHPALRPRRRPKRTSSKQRRTTVRTAKLLNVTYFEDENGKMQERVTLHQVPIEISFNNMGTLKDPTGPLRHYLDKGFQWPHEYDREKYPGVYCAVLNCWDWATVSDDPVNGSERCAEHDEMFRKGIIRYNEGGVGSAEE